MEKKRILVTVKTYPTPATTYTETVCTAGITEDGEWIRIYPIRYRMLDHEKQYSKYDWIEVEVEKRPGNKDNRPESYHCNSETIRIVGNIGIDRPHWPNRRKICLQKVYTNFAKLLEDSEWTEKCISLATFKPSEIVEFTCDPKDTSDTDQKKDEIVNNLKAELSLFGSDIPVHWKMASTIPYRFGYTFIDSEGKPYNLMIEDWEIFALFRRYPNNPELACEKVREKYFNNFVETKDVHFFLGTVFSNHRRRFKQPFSIIGVFPPAYEPRDSQLHLDL